MNQVLESVTYKAQQDGSVLYMVNNQPAFTDHGQHILVDRKADEYEKSILAAILLAFVAIISVKNDQSFQILLKNGKVMIEAIVWFPELSCYSLKA